MTRQDDWLGICTEQLAQQWEWLCGRSPYMSFNAAGLGGVLGDGCWCVLVRHLQAAMSWLLTRVAYTVFLVVSDTVPRRSW